MSRRFIKGVRLFRLAGYDFLVAGREAYGKVPDAVALTEESARIAEAVFAAGDAENAGAAGKTPGAEEFLGALTELGYLTEDG